MTTTQPTNTIVSSHNAQLKQLRRLQRKRERQRTGLFAAEGEDLIDAALAAGRSARAGFRVHGCAAGDRTFFEVDQAALSAVSALGSGTRVAAIFQQRFLPAPVGPLCLYLHNIADPGNVGTILRAAAAFGASSVALGPRCADPHGHKAVRASMGAIFTTPLASVSESDLQRLPSALPGETIALAAGSGPPLSQLLNKGLPRPLTLLIGAEREGLPREILAGCAHVAHIPIATESLNAAIAASIALYEVSRASASASNRVQAS